MNYTNPYGKKFYISVAPTVERKQYKHGQGADMRILSEDSHQTITSVTPPGGDRSNNRQILFDGMAMVPLKGEKEVGTVLTFDGRDEYKKHSNKDFLFVANGLGTYFIKHVLSEKWLGLDDVITPTKLVLVNEAFHVSFTYPI